MQSKIMSAYSSSKSLHHRIFSQKALVLFCMFSLLGRFMLIKKSSCKDDSQNAAGIPWLLILATFLFFINFNRRIKARPRYGWPDENLHLENPQSAWYAIWPRPSKNIYCSFGGQTLQGITSPANSRLFPIIRQSPFVFLFVALSWSARIWVAN